MGGSCSIQRRSTRGSENKKKVFVEAHDNSNNKTKYCLYYRSLRHSVESELPDRAIATLYPVHDNYIVVQQNSSESGLGTTLVRSPKRLFDLCVEQVCRSLPDLDGELPPGLPQDLVSAIVKSLVSHSALNGTTLKALKNCELGELPLGGCRGVKDDWLRGLVSKNKSSPIAMSLVEDDMKISGKCSIAEIKGGDDSSSSCSTSSFLSATSSPETLCDCNSLKTTPDMFNLLYSTSTNVSHSVVSTSTMTVLDLRGSSRLTDRGLLQLRDVSLLEIAKLDNCHNIIGRGLVAFSSCHRLNTLSLANCRRLSDEAIVNISHLTSLNALSLDGCRNLTVMSMEALGNLHQLCKLDLSQCDLITDEGMEYLKNLEYLQELSLGWVRNITDVGIEMLCNQPNRCKYLRILRLSRCCSITDVGVSHLSKLSMLQELDLNGCSSITSAALALTLEKLKCLNTLDVSYCPGILRLSWQGKINALQTLELGFSNVQDRHLSKLTNLPSLLELNLDSCPIGDWAISHLADSNVTPNLLSLDLADTDVTDLGMVHIPKFTKLEKLSLFYCNITNAGLRHLSNMKDTLKVLNLDSREIGDEGLYHLRKFKKMKKLDIFSGRVTDAGCSFLSQITSLESLELCGGGVGDLGCAHLANLENLTSLNLSQNERISNRGAAALATLTNLRALNLSNTRVNSAALRFLGGLVKLQSLALYGCRGIDDIASINLLHNELPSLKCLRLNTSKNHETPDVVMMEDDDNSSNNSILNQDEIDFVDELDTDTTILNHDANRPTQRNILNANSRSTNNWQQHDTNRIGNRQLQDYDEVFLDEEMEEVEERNSNEEYSIEDDDTIVDEDNDGDIFFRAQGYFSDDTSLAS